jgi:hypothetical protein
MCIRSSFTIAQQERKKSNSEAIMYRCFVTIHAKQCLKSFLLKQSLEPIRICRILNSNPSNFGEPRNCFGKRILVILRDCIFDCRFIVSNTTINAKTGDIVFSLLRICKVIEKFGVVISFFQPGCPRLLPLADFLHKGNILQI